MNNQHSNVYEIALTYKKRAALPAAGLCNSPEAVAAYLQAAIEADPEYDPTVEHFFALFLNRKNRPIGFKEITRGTATSSLVHPREVFKPAICSSCSSIIVAHNHPSGDPSPSSADIQVTRQIREAGKVLGIELLDHVILGEREFDPRDTGFYSFKESGLI